MRQKTLLSSKGMSVADLGKVGFALVFLVVTLAVGVWVNQNFAETAFTGVSTNQSQNFAVNDTWYNTNYRAADGSISVINYTDELPSANIDTTDNGYVSMVKLYTNDTYLVGTYNISYKALSEDGYLVSANATSGLVTLSNWIPIIAIVIAAAVVIGVIMLYFAKKGGGM